MSRLLAAAVVALGLLTVGCGSADKAPTPFVLRITSSDSEQAVRIDGTVGSSITLPAAAGMTVTISVAELTGDQVRIRTDPALVAEAGSSGLGTEFTVGPNAPAVLVTPTTDTATTFTIAWEQKHPVD